jgi:hypothetical protein
MRFYNQRHAAYCGVDLHARSMYLHILDDRTRTRLNKAYRHGTRLSLKPAAPMLIPTF